MKARPSSNRFPFRTVAIVGVGLIGGSIALALKQKVPGLTIIGVDRASVLKKALARKAIDRGVVDIEEGVCGADLVILAQPLAEILRSLPAVASSVSSTTIVTDVGSVKRCVLEQARQLFPDGNFIGGHPMAGSERFGFVAADPLLFENAVYLLTPLRRTPPAMLRQLKTYVDCLGARPLLIDANIHDTVTASVSHVPQLVSVALVNAATQKQKVVRERLSLAAGGFRDMTRIASSKYDMWDDIFSLNAREIKKALRFLIDELASYENIVRKGSLTQLRKRFDAARKTRSLIPKTMKGFLTPLFDISVFMNDRPGELARLTAVLFKAHVNIKDIELIKIREGMGGTFRLSFENRNDATKGGTVLKKAGFVLNE